MKTILVTGGAGFIGSNFVRYILDINPDIYVINLDALTYAGSTENLTNLPGDSRHKFIHGDITDESLVEKLFTTYPIDTVVHLAAESHVDRSIYGPAEFINTNIIGTFTLLEAASKHWKNNLADKRFHHVSTDEVFGSLSPNDAAFSESSRYAPRSPYSASKASSDHLVRAYYHTYGLPVTISNCSNNYGPYQHPEKFIPLIVTNCLNGKPIPIYGDGKQIRDWLYVEDHCEAIYLILISGSVGETYNIGGDCQPTNVEIVKIICKMMDKQFPDSPHTPHENLIAFVKDRPGHDRRYAMDLSKIKRDLGWEPSEDIKSGLKKTISWFLSNSNWLNEINKRDDFNEWEEKNYRHR